MGGEGEGTAQIENRNPEVMFRDPERKFIQDRGFRNYLFLLSAWLAVRLPSARSGRAERHLSKSSLNFCRRSFRHSS